MDVGFWIGIGIMGLYLGTIGILYFRLELSINYRYCSRCGQYMNPVPYKNRILKKLLKFNRVCYSSLCTSIESNRNILAYKLTNAGGIMLSVWLPFYFFLFRTAPAMSNIQRLSGDLITIGLTILSVFIARYLYTQKRNQFPEFFVDVS